VTNFPEAHCLTRQEKFEEFVWYQYSGCFIRLLQRIYFQKAVIYQERIQFNNSKENFEEE